MYDPSSPLLRSGATSDAPPAAQAKARFAEDRLLDAVIWCEIAPGEIVTEADAMTRFGLTRAAARAGLVRLGYDGWAMPQPRTGWLVLPVTGALIGQVLDARHVAEPALGQVRLRAAARTEMLHVKSVLATLAQRREPSAVAARRHYTDRVDGLLLEAMNPFTARHLRKLWHHTDRMMRFLEDPARDRIFDRYGTITLINAVLDTDADAVHAARLTLLTAQRAFFLQQLLNSDAPLTSGSGGAVRSDTAANNRREI